MGMSIRQLIENELEIINENNIWEYDDYKDKYGINSCNVTYTITDNIEIIVAVKLSTNKTTIYSQSSEMGSISYSITNFQSIINNLIEKTFTKAFNNLKTALEEQE